MNNGALQEYYSGNWTLRGSRSVTGVTDTTSNGVMYPSMPASSALSTKPWARRRQTAAACGAVTTCLGFVLSSFSTHVWHLVATQGVLAACRVTQSIQSLLSQSLPVDETRRFPTKVLTSLLYAPPST